MVKQFLQKRLPAALVAFLILATSLGIGGLGMVGDASAAGCGGAKIFFGRAKNCGYFRNQNNAFGLDVRNGGIPASVNSVNELINMLNADRASGDSHKVTAANFMILTMIGRPAGLPNAVTAAQLSDFNTRIHSYSNISENGTTSVGTSGRIDWHVFYHWPCGTVNTIYQNTEVDVSPYIESSTNGDCAGSALDDHIYFRNTAGTPIYVIRRACMNPIGKIGPLAASVPPAWSLTPTVGATVNGSATTVGVPGDTVAFTYTVRNAGPNATTASCNIRANTYPGVHAASSTPSNTGPPGPATSCPRSFPVGTTVIVATETVVIPAGNQTICRSIFVAPASASGGQRGDEICIVAANKPYMKIYGGDVSVGNANTASCTTNTNGAIMTWNERAANGYAGAGTQYAAFAMKALTDFATAQSPVGTAAEPTGLSFANTGANPAGGDFGGDFGSVPCMTDYYATRPATTLAPPANVSAMTTGVYGANSGANITGGIVNPGEKITYYVNGNVFINSDITYAGNWNYNNIPLFQLVVSGNIYISSNVHRLDGVYIAQRNGATGSAIYTCATSAAAPVLANGAFFNACNSKLVVNGAFIAGTIEFLRTGGSVDQSAPNETSNAAGAGNNAAEVFNFNPSVWMTQPNITGGRVDNYDAITSLPPVL